jgi:hypothetical protein
MTIVMSVFVLSGNRVRLSLHDCNEPIYLELKSIDSHFFDVIIFWDPSVDESTNFPRVEPLG